MAVNFNTMVFWDVTPIYRVENDGTSFLWYRGTCLPTYCVPCCCYWLEETAKYKTGVTSNSITSVWNFVNISQLVQKLKGGYKKTQHGDHISLLPFHIWGGVTRYDVPSPIPYAKPEPLSLGQLPAPRDTDSATSSLLDIPVHFVCCALKNGATSTYFNVKLNICFLTILHRLQLRSVFLVAGTTKLTVIWNVTLHSLVACSQCSGGNLVHLPSG
jgi:hypothetical protein